jgi:hypothetical protein
MKKFEYIIIVIYPTDDYLSVLNNYGQEGWELVAITSDISADITHGWKYYFFKRQI